MLNRNALLVKKKYKEYGNISTKEFTNEIKKKHPNLKNEPEKIIKIAKFSIKEYFYNNTIEYKVDAFSHKDTLENFTGNCIIRARMLDILWSSLDIPIIGAIAPNHFFSIIKLPTEEYISLDGSVKFITISKEKGIQLHKDYKWLILGNHDDLAFSSTMAWEGSIQRIKGNLVEAEKYYMKAFYYSPSETYSCPDFIFNYANILFLQKKYKEAFSNYERCLIFFSNHAKAKIMLEKCKKIINK